jgi:hypothetical protein
MTVPCVPEKKRLHARRMYRRANDIVSRIIEQYNIDENQAIHTFYNSQTYKLLSDEDTKVWWLSTPAILDIYQAEVVAGDIGASPYVDGLV